MPLLLNFAGWATGISRSLTLILAVSVEEPLFATSIKLIASSSAAG
jgi:hypothetical protein